MSYTLDSNILIRSIEKNHSQQDEALDVINKLIGRGAEVFLLPQSLYEFWVVATRPRKDNGLEMSAAEAEAVLAKFESVFPLKHDAQATYQVWRQLVTQHAVLGKNAHDARIAAALKTHGITHLVTFNKNHFKRFAEITALLPSEV
ncbi:MAG: type II toxin-antitoxin system VapC family toxin [Acidobacteria bacterium]|nr:type II toxin-antitoxin system VapC family toxin [Acidobacteriota bacterium]